MIFLTWNGAMIAQSSLDSLDYQIGLKVSASRISGTFSRSTFATGLETHLTAQGFVFHNSLSYRYSQFNGRKIEDNWYDLLTLFYYPNGRKIWYPAIFYHFDNNLLFKVNSRHRFGGGIGTVPIETKSIFLRLAVGWAYEDIQYNGENFINSDLDMSRRSNGLLIARINHDYHLFDDRLILKILAMYMQSTREAADFDIWLIPSLQFGINKTFSVFINYDYRYEHVHLEGISPANDVLVAGLTINFSNK